jgi:hypothetical protein
MADIRLHSDWGWVRVAFTIYGAPNLYFQ